ncbi:factor C small subunit [Seminavis robusta]|uniref:Factor C small subunit n=1 Tax=Seminavis robusta TaxID=568900 RepID=A0A9N8HJV8_9STRA|nr:factor C small subunit [Seminavis robusta]|eukprot:Sro793_g203250.1 factor C small subunit (354) ;mRNA; r:24501-25879
MTGTDDGGVKTMEVDGKQHKDKKAEERWNQLPWVEKYRPDKLDDLVAHDDIIQIIKNLIEQDQLPHLLLYGPPGTGKTSTIVAAAKKMYGSHAAYKSMTLELNASDARGIDVVRNQIKEFAGTKQLFSKGIKLIILDECDAMTNDAQFALRRIIEKYTSNARFCLICNYVSKIIPALQSRCTRFRFAPLARDQIEGRLTEIAQKEHCNTTPDGMDAILRLSGGDMRRVLNLLQATSMSSDEINGTTVYQTSGAPLPTDVTIILDLLLNQSMQTAVTDILKLCGTKGYALVDILQELTFEITALDLPGPALATMLDGMSDIEHRLAFGTSEKIQTAALVGVFVKARHQMEMASE